MRQYSKKPLAAAVLAALGTTISAAGAEIHKLNNTTALNDPASWLEGIVPSTSDVAVWDAAVLAANAPLTGGSLSWSGIKIVDPAGLVTIGGATPTAGTTLTIGTSGINMSGATQNLVISSPTTALTGATQSWVIASGRNLRFGTTGAGFASANLDGTDGTVVSVSGGGVVDANQGGAAGFADAAGFAGFNGKWVVQSGATLRGLRNGATAWGTSTAADAISLEGGTLAVGGISGTQGNWTWNTNITLASSTSSTIDNQTFASGTNRFLKLNGALSGSGDLTFVNTSTTTMNNADFGLILAGTNSNSGLVTITPGAFVRVGGVGGTDTGTAAGTTGTLGDGSATNNVVNNGTLTFARSNAITVPNAISGSGTVRIGASALAATGTQVVTLTGANTYTGATQVNLGRLTLTGSLTSNVSVASGARLAGSGSSTGSLTTVAGASLGLAGGLTTSALTFNGVTFGGATSVVFDTAPVPSTSYDVLSYGAGGVSGTGNLAVQARGTLTDDTSAQKLVFTVGAVATRTWNTTSGTWENGGASTNWLEGDQKFYGGDTAVFGDVASDSTITLSGLLTPASVTVSNAANKYTLTGTAGTSEITGGASLTKSGAGTLAITTRQSYTGGTTIEGGVVDLTAGGGGIGVLRGAVTVNAGGTLRLSTGDATGFNTDATRISAINLNGGTLDVNTAANQTLGSAVINMTGGNITGIAGSNIDLFANGSAVNTLASAASSVIATPTINLRQNDTVFDVADGTAAADLIISSAIGNGTAGNHNMIKNGAGTMALTGVSTFTGNVTVNNGVLDLTGGKLYNAAFINTPVVTVKPGGTVKVASFSYDVAGGMGKLADYRQRRVLDGGAIEVTGGTHSSGNDFTVTAAGGTFRYNPADTSNTLTLTGNANTNILLDGTLALDTLGNLTVNEVLEGAGGITKTGAGALVLGAANTYTGPTTINAGQLIVNGALAGSAGIGNGVGGAVVLGGTGSIGGAITVATNGVLSPGATDAVGTLTLTAAGGVTLGGTMLVDVDGTDSGTTDLLTGAGTLDISGGTVNFRVLTGLNDAAYVFADYDTLVGSAFATVLNLPAGYTVDYNYGGASQIALVNSVPEPSSVIAILGLAASTLIGRRRRNK